jgi:hypothetical protein
MKRKKKVKHPVFPVRPEDQKLLEACQTLNYQRIMAAIQAGGDVNALDGSQKMAVIDVLTSVACVPEYRNDTAMQENVLKIITQLLALGAKPDGATCDDTPLHNFSWTLYDWNVCSELIRSGAKINRVLDERMTALDFVAEEIMFLEITDEENRAADLTKLEHLYTQMVRHGALHYNELQEKHEKYYEKTKKI